MPRLGENIKCRNWLVACPGSDPSRVSQQADGIQVAGPQVDGAEVEGGDGTKKWPAYLASPFQSFLGQEGLVK